MGKKILKRSLALGALMAFVITGNVWAEEYNDFKFPTGMNSIYSDGYHYYPDPSEIKNHY